MSLTRPHTLDTFSSSLALDAVTGFDPIPEVPRAGVDWSTTDHATCVMDPAGRVLARETFAHTQAGIAQLVAHLAKHKVVEVGIERADGPLVEALLAARLTVLVIPPAQVKNMRGRYGSAGNKDDRFDAYVLADVTRTDRRRLLALERPSAATVALRQAVRTRKDLVAARVSAANQLLAHLQHTLPGAIGLFNDLDNQISLAFLDRFPTQVEADWLTAPRLATWLAKHAYPRARAETLIAHLQAAARGLAGPGATGHASTHAAVTRAHVVVLQALTAAIKDLEGTIATALADHPDQHLFAALPRTQALRQARLIAEIGDARGRFPTREALAALAGVVPSTRQSGNTRIVAFRWGVDKQLRDAICDFAGDSRLEDPWAHDLYQRARDRGHDHQHAVRILARAWTAILWHCWHDHVPYDPAKHNARTRIIKQQAT